MYTKQTFRFATLLAFKCLFITALVGQKIESVEVWLDTNTMKTLQYVVASDNQSLVNTELKSTSFPIAIIPELFFKQMLKVNKERIFLSAATQSKIAFLERMDSLSNLDIKHRNDYIELQKKQLDLCNNANTQLNNAISSLNGQLDKAIQLSVVSIKHERGKKIGIGAVAGLAGLALGILLSR
jgi:hypothetical protein